ncbi:hypothetical protein HUN01_05280 [Nostoc edaphicum CCNP1411]|uniref:Uncharacterized protein n=1 Tax=Nostoc edaphicum CCNP1411 TaxID=1472755 RepID=A0A7D7L8S3_9NOSO|nr:hypothetical protein [Nostoc edaphicum]QMS87013.1 hypothetical protein HUN01_05280 [Nostoc edaphicum CCNP1411]
MICEWGIGHWALGIGGGRGVEFKSIKDSFPIPHAPCPMPHAPCPMPHAPCPIF